MRPPREVMSVGRVISTHYASEGSGLCGGDVGTEDLEYVEDPRISKNRIVCNGIMLGTAGQESRVLAEGDDGYPQRSSSRGIPLPPVPLSTPALAAAHTLKDERTTTLTKVGFSSGLSRSTKHAVLASMLYSYLIKIHTIPRLLSRDSKLPFTRSFIR